MRYIMITSWPNYWDNIDKIPESNPWHKPHYLRRGIKCPEGLSRDIVLSITEDVPATFVKVDSKTGVLKAWEGSVSNVCQGSSNGEPAFYFQFRIDKRLPQELAQKHKGQKVGWYVEVPEWQAFKIDSPRRTKGVLLKTVSHVTHIDQAFEVFEMRRIKQGLVYDESKLKTERILVCWLSPNDWSYGDGFRYGNVRFTFDWKELVANKKYYWIESISYKPPACRILITDEDYSGEFCEYDPTRGDGPWWYDKEYDTHYWKHGNLTLEFMLEFDVDIGRAIEIDFVKHHPQQCNISWEKCSNLGLNADKAAGLFLAKLLARKPPSEMIKLIKENVRPAKDDFDAVMDISGGYPLLLRPAWNELWRELGNFEINYEGNMTVEHESALPLARAILSLYAQSSQDELSLLASLFQSKDELGKSCRRLIADTFSLSQEDASDIMTV